MATARPPNIAVSMPCRAQKWLAGWVHGVHVADECGRAVVRDAGRVGAGDVDGREVAETVAWELAQHPGVPGARRRRAVGPPGGLQRSQQVLTNDGVEEDTDREVGGEAGHGRSRPGLTTVVC